MLISSLTLLFYKKKQPQNIDFASISHIYIRNVVTLIRLISQLADSYNTGAILIYRYGLTLYSILTPFDAFEISHLLNIMENAPLSIIFSKVFKT